MNLLCGSSHVLFSSKINIHVYRERELTFHEVGDVWRWAVLFVARIFEIFFNIEHFNITNNST